MIAGPFDATDRFGYWVARFLHPALLGERPPQAVVPAPCARPVQVIDARDLAAWMVALLEGDVAGTFNACSAAGLWTFGDLVDALAGLARAGPRPAWVDDATLLAHAVLPWVGLPLWLPATEPDSAGYMSIDCGKAQQAGLATRPLARTIADAAAWLAARGNEGAWKQVLSAQQEREILAG